MNELLQHPELGEIRVIKTNGEVWFCGKDVCNILGYTNHRKSLKDHCREEGVTNCYVHTNGGKQEMIFVNEANLYRLILKSHMPQAIPFENWVCDKVLPAIRKYGYYSTDTKKMASAQKRVEMKAKKELFAEIDKRISTSDKRIIGKQCLTNEYDVNKVLRVEKEDVYMATLLYNKAVGNKELHSAFYTHQGAQDLLKNLISQNAKL